MSSLGIVIPTLNAANTLPRALEALSGDGLNPDIVVCDGGSADTTVDIAQRFGARVTESLGGRGAQLAEGARTVLGDWLLFLHADTIPPPDWAETVTRFMDTPENRSRAGYFRFALDDPAPKARQLERLVRWRCRWLGLPYGDQGLLLSRSLYDALGGYPAVPLMEDVALVRRLGRARLVELPGVAVTGAARYRRHGYLLRSARNLVCLALYFLGLPPAAIKRIYG